jgi:hypothetical protein
LNQFLHPSEKGFEVGLPSRIIEVAATVTVHKVLLSVDFSAIDQSQHQRIHQWGAKLLDKVDNKWKALMNSLEALSRTDPEGTKLLRLKAQGLSWKEIHQLLVKEDGEAKSESTLRQKGCRATKTLIKIYHSETSNSADLQIL